MEELLRLWVSTPSLPGDQRVRLSSSDATSRTTQPTALPTAGRGQLLRAEDPALWAGAFIMLAPSTACSSLRQYAFRRAGCREIRLSGSTRGEWAAPQGVTLSPTLPRSDDFSPAW